MNPQRLALTERRRAALRVGTVSVRAVATVIDAGVAAGVRRDILMTAADATNEDLRDPDARLPVASVVALWQALAKHIADPGFAVRAGAALRTRQLGLVGYVASFSATLRDALERVERYGRLLTEEVEFRLDAPRPQGALVVRRIAPGSDQPFSQDYALAGALQVSRELTGLDITPTEVSFTYEQPSSIVAHRRHFRSPLHFGEKAAAITLRARDLALPIRKADEMLAGYLSKYAEVALGSLTRGQTTRHSVRAAIWSVLADGKPSLDRVAAALHVAPRTLQRRLAEERTSLQTEIETIRKTMGMAMLRDHSYSVEDVAFLLGYSEPSAFYRSFRRWTGTTPGQFRMAE